MKRLALLAVLAAGCTTQTTERLEKAENRIQGQILKSNRLEEDQQKLAERVAIDLEKLRKDLKGFRDELDLLRSQLATIRKEAIGPAGGTNVEAERAAQQEIEYIRRSPKNPQTVAAAVKRLRPVSATAVPFLLMELKQALRRADLPVASALEKVLAGLEPDVVARALIPELDNKRIRTLAASILGELGHTSARQPLVRQLNDPDFKFRFVAGSALVKLKGPEGKRGIPVLIEALKPIHRDLNILAYDTLHRLTGFSFGYKMFAPDEQKMASAAKWEEWWKMHGDTFEFPEK
jgi:HEAT repeat protein